MLVGGGGVEGRWRGVVEGGMGVEGGGGGGGGGGAGGGVEDRLNREIRLFQLG